MKQCTLQLQHHAGGIRDTGQVCLPDSPLQVQLEQVRALRIKQQDEAILRDVRKAVAAMEEVADSVDARRAQVPLQRFPGRACWNSILRNRQWGM